MVPGFLVNLANLANLEILELLERLEDLENLVFPVYPGLQYLKMEPRISFQHIHLQQSIHNDL
jgi:hypothetical protein